jgi:alpha-tubulin suppressor-like RCC1 family protein
MKNLVNKNEKFDQPERDKIVSISLGFMYSSALSSNGRVFTWGSNSHGELGDGTTEGKLLPTEITSKFNLAYGDKIIALTLGGNHASALSWNGRVFTWGDNNFGNIGDGTVSSDGYVFSSENKRGIPTEITNNFNLGAYDKIVAISRGDGHSSAISFSGRVFTWGSNSHGELGDGTKGVKNYKSLPTEITPKFKLNADDKIVAISLGNGHSSAISCSGRVFTWGSNFFGQLGDRTVTDKSLPTEITYNFNLEYRDKIVAVSLGNNNSSALSLNGCVFTWGENDHGTLGNGRKIAIPYPIELDYKINSSLDVTDKIVAISLGYQSSSALSLNGSVFTWGKNESGKLGDGEDVWEKLVPSEITYNFDLDDEDKIVAVSLGTNNHASAISLSGRVYTWGENLSGELGDGTTTDKTYPIEITSKFKLT